MKDIIYIIIFFILDIACNVISLIILPQSYKFKKDYLAKLVDFDINIDFSYIESKLSSPRKTCTAILVFGCFLGVFHIIKIIALI